MPDITIPPFDLWDNMDILIQLWTSVNYYVFGFQSGLLIFIVYRVVMMTIRAINKQAKTVDQ